MSNSTDVVSLLLANGANPNEQSNGITLLHIAVTKRDENNMAKLLLNSGANANVKTNASGETPLHIAVQKRDQEIVKLLVDKSADVNARDIHGATALHIAAGQCNIGATTLLLNKKANVNLRDNLDTTPLHFVAYRHHSLFREGNYIPNLGRMSDECRDVASLLLVKGGRRARYQ